MGAGRAGELARIVRNGARVAVLAERAAIRAGARGFEKSDWRWRALEEDIARVVRDHALEVAVADEFARRVLALKLICRGERWQRRFAPWAHRGERLRLARVALCRALMERRAAREAATLRGAMQRERLLACGVSHHG